MKPFPERCERIQIEELVHIPTADGNGTAETIPVQVPAWRDPKDGEIYLDNEATEILDRVKARYLGLLTPEQIKSLRQQLGLTQSALAELLQIGDKTWSRWETGRERPSRSINLLLSALHEGALDVAFLQHLARRRKSWTVQASLPSRAPSSGNFARMVAQSWDQLNRTGIQSAPAGPATEPLAELGHIWTYPGRAPECLAMRDLPAQPFFPTSPVVHPRLDTTRAFAELGLPTQG